MEKFSVTDILNVIEVEQLDLQDSLNQLLKNPNLSGSEKDFYSASCGIRVYTLEVLKSKFV